MIDPDFDRLMADAVDTADRVPTMSSYRGSRSRPDPMPEWTEAMLEQMLFPIEDRPSGALDSWIHRPIFEPVRGRDEKQVIKALMEVGAEPDPVVWPAFENFLRGLAYGWILAYCETFIPEIGRLYWKVRKS